MIRIVLIAIALCSLLWTQHVMADFVLQRITIGSAAGKIVHWKVSGTTATNFDLSFHNLNNGEVGSKTLTKANDFISHTFTQKGIYEVTIQPQGTGESSKTLLQIVGPSTTEDDPSFTPCNSANIYDVIVVDGTSAGIGAAITAAREGLSTCLLESTSLIGGMFTNGIGKTDVGLHGFGDPGFQDSHFLTLSHGLMEELRRKIVSLYKPKNVSEDNYKGKGLIYTPSMMREALYEVIKEVINNKNCGGESCLHITLNAPFQKATNESSFVVTVNRMHPSITSSEYKARYLVDATDSGDVVASLLGESCCVVGKEGKVQAYSYVMTITDHGSAEKNWSYMKEAPSDCGDEGEYTKVSVLEPKHDNGENYWTANSGKLDENIYQVKHHKLLGENSLGGCPLGDELLDTNVDIAKASNDAERVDVFERYINHSLCFLYKMQRLTRKDGTKDEGVGLTTNEDPMRGNFPARLYVREGRRIKGKISFNEEDASKAKESSDRPNQEQNKLRQSIGVVTYTMDSHATTTDVCPHGNFAENMPRTGPGVIPLGVMFPNNLDKVLVPLAASSSHEGYSTLRLDPTRLNMGMVAALAIKISMEKGINPPELLKPEKSLYLYELQRRLIKRGGRIFLYTNEELHPNIGNNYDGEEADMATQFLGIWGDKLAENIDYSFNSSDQFKTAIEQYKKRLIQKFSDDGTIDNSAKSAIAELVHLGVMQGNPDGTFAPKRIVNRAEFSKMVVLAAEMPLSTGKTNFPDVVRGSWYEPYVKTLSEKKVNGDDEFVIEGYNDGTFMPEKPINFAEAAKIVTFGFDLKPRKAKEGKEKWYARFVECANNLQILSPMSEFELSEFAKREETALMIYNALIASKDGKSCTQ